MKRLNNLQGLLIVILILSLFFMILYGIFPGRDMYWGRTDHYTGLESAVLSCGLLAVTSLIGIIWIEITRFKSKK